MIAKTIEFTAAALGQRVARTATAALLALSFTGASVISAQAEEFTDGREINLATASHLASQKLLLDVAKANGRLVAVGEFGHVVYSDDEGQTWTQAESVETQVTLTAVSFPTEEIGYAVGHDAVILKTEDGGNNWKLIHREFDAETPLLTVYFDSANHGFALGAFAYMLETNDGGATWNQRPIIPDGDDDFHLNDAFVTANGTVFIAAEFGTVYRSTDGGVTFERLQTPYEGSFWGGIGLRDGAVLIYGMRGNVYRTEDNGTTWTKVETGVRKSFGGSVELEDGTVVLAGLNGAIAYSKDGGKSFETISRPDREGYNAVIGTVDDQIAIFGESGVKLMPDSYEAAVGENS